MTGYNQPEKPRIKYNIISTPSEEELRPTELEQQEINRLLRWEERSKLVDWVVGTPREINKNI